MPDDLIETAATLAGMLTRENSALAALDLALAGRMLDEKTAAAAAFSHAVQQTAKSGGIVAGQRGRAEQLGTLLRELGEENRRLLERAIHVQGRVLASIARALPKAHGVSQRYGATGGLTRARHVQAIALFSRV